MKKIIDIILENEERIHRELSFGLDWAANEEASKKALKRKKI